MELNKTKRSIRPKGQTLKQQKVDRQNNGVVRDGVARYGLASHLLVYRESIPPIGTHRKSNNAEL